MSKVTTNPKRENSWSYISQLEDKNVKLFNKVMRREGRRLKMGITQSDADEYPFLASDVILIKPKGISLSKTAYGFFPKISNLTFFSKSENLGKNELYFVLSRTCFYYANRRSLKHPPLCVLVAPSFPKVLTEVDTESKIIFNQDPKHPWLWKARLWSDVALVVCSEVPLKKRFYNFLAFATPNSDKWRKFVVTLAEENNQRLLKVVSQLHPTEYQQLAETVKGLVSEKVLSAEVYSRMQAALTANK